MPNEFVISGMAINDSVTTSLSRVKGNSPTDTLFMTQGLVYFLTPAPNQIAVDDAIGVASEIDPGATRGESIDATVIGTVTVNTDRPRSLSDDVPIVDDVSYYIASVGWINPIVVVPSNTGSLTLSFEDEEVTLRAPDFGDSNSCDFFRVSRTSRGGDLQIFQDPKWPKTEILSFKFSYLDPEVVDDFLDFLKTSLGGLVTMVDHYGRSWEGYIITPAGDVVQEKRTTKTAAFKFQVKE